MGRIEIKAPAPRGTGRLALCVLLSAIPVGAVMSCTGPQPLSLAIRQRDEDGYLTRLNAVNGDAAQAYANWMADERSTTAEEILREDKRLGTRRNPFDAHRDPTAVSRGAVIYKLHCARCHGDDARGRGPSSLPDHPGPDFRSFGNRLASTLHRGAPRRWFRVIRDGSGEVVEYPDERTTAMPAFGDKMTRGQIWLVITYLQSLDMHLPRANGGMRREASP